MIGDVELMANIVKSSSINIKAMHLSNQSWSSKYMNADWGTVAFYMPRAELNTQFIDAELQYNCIYFLIGNDGIKWRCYVGQAKKRNNGGSVLLRLREHDKSITERYCEDWDRAVIVTNKDDAWGLDDLNALEHQLYNEIPSSKRLNGNEPNSGRADSRMYIDKVKQIKSYMALLGLDIFEEPEGIDEMNITQLDDVNVPVEDLQRGLSRIPEIVTPHNTVKKMVDTLPDDVWNPETTFLDLACKGGEYLKEVFDRLMKAEPLQAMFPNEIARAFHILDKQIFGIALSSISLERTVNALNGYNRNIKMIPGYIRYLKYKDDGKMFKSIIEEEFERMKFDVVIGNPPYNEKDGGAKFNDSSSPIYSDFVLKGADIADRYMSMVIPSRWLSGGKLTLDKFRLQMIESKHIKNIHYYSNPRDVFPGIDIAGGVLYFLYDTKGSFEAVDFFRCTRKQSTCVKKDLSKYTYHDASGKKQYMILTDEYADDIISKIENAGDKLGIGIQYDPFGFLADFEGQAIPFKGSVKVVCSNGRETYTYRDNVEKSFNKIDKYKVIVGKVTGFTDSKQNRGNEHPIINVPRIIGPGEVCTITYFVLGSTYDLEEAKNLLSFVKTKLFRYLVMVTIGGMNLSQRNFRFIPQLSDFSHHWTDDMLYKKYGLSQEEISYIEHMIKQMG